MQNITEEQRMRWRIGRFTEYTKKIMGVNPNYHSEEIQQIERNENNEIYFLRQFVDANPGLTQEDYNAWFKKAKNTFFFTVEASGVLLSDKPRYEGDYSRIRAYHSIDDELSRPVLEEYSINQIMSTLKLLDIYTIMLLFSTDVKIERIGSEGFVDDNKFVTGVIKKEDGSEMKIASRPKFRGKSICFVDEGQKGRIVDGKFMNANEFVFKQLRLPINILLNSVNEAIDPYKLPNEGLDDVPFDSELSFKIRSIRLGDSYNQLVENTKTLGRN